jgi:hypothetical protein
MRKGEVDLGWRAFAPEDLPRDTRPGRLQQRNIKVARAPPSHAPKITTTPTSTCRHVYRASETRHGYQGVTPEGLTQSSQ